MSIVVGADGKPVAVPDTLNVAPDTPVSGSLAGNDTPSPDGGNVWTLGNPPTNGTVTINPDGTFTYTPTPGFSGTDSFTYVITDGDGDTSTATVSIVVGTGGVHNGNRSDRGDDLFPRDSGSLRPVTPVPFSRGSEFSRLPPLEQRISQTRIAEPQRILAQAMGLSEFPRHLEAAYVQWINLRYDERTVDTISIPPEALSILTGTNIRSEAKLADGSPLPFWISFDADARALRVNPPLDLEHRSMTVKIWFWDEKSNEAVVSITLNVERDSAQGAAMEQAEHHFWETEQEVASRPGRMTDVVLPLESRHTDVLKGKRISMTATLADGSPLPKGLALDARTGVVSGKVLVQSRETTLDVRVIATDELGNRSEVVHHLHILPAAGNQAAVGMDQAATLAARPSFSEQLAACPVA